MLLHFKQLIKVELRNWWQKINFFLPDVKASLAMRDVCKEYPSPLGVKGITTLVYK